MFFDTLFFGIDDLSIIDNKLSLLSLISPKTAGANLVEVLKRSVKKLSPFIDFLHGDFQKPFFSFKNDFILT